jgi:hypothetical protein
MTCLASPTPHQEAVQAAQDQQQQPDQEEVQLTQQHRVVGQGVVEVQVAQPNRPRGHPSRPACLVGCQALAPVAVLGRLM